MAYTAVPTISTGDTWTAANHNAYIKDNFAAAPPDIFTTKGDIAIGEGADTAARLGVGSSGQILTASSAETLGMVWGNISSGIIFNAYTNADFDGDDIYNTPGTFSVDVTDATGFNAPAGIQIAFTRVKVLWESAGDSVDYIAFGTSADTTYEFLKFYRYGDTNWFKTQIGLLFLEDDKFQYTLSDSSDANIEVEIFGYIQ